MHFNALVSELSVSNLKNSLDFYVGILGFQVEYERLQDKFAYLSYGAAQIMLEQINENWNTGELNYPFGRGINLQIETDNVQKISDILQQNGINAFKDIFESDYVAGNRIFKQREILIQDPDGYLLRFSQDVENRG